MTPILIHACAANKKLVAIEQPELHLHPALQAELGDVFIESALGENKNTFLLEKRFHARYFLTDIGGVGSDYGLDEGRSDGDETDLYLLTEDKCVQRTADFSINGNVFRLVAGPLEFSGIG